MSNNNTSIESVAVSSFMTADVITATENQTIREVCKIMNANQIGSIVILKNNIGKNSDPIKPIGIITERDIVRLIGYSEKLLVDVPIVQLMSSPLITINPNNSMADAVEIMQQKDIRRLPVVDNKGKMVGIITDKDVIKKMIKHETLLTSFLSDQSLVDQKSPYTKFSDYWFKDMLPWR